MDTDEKEEELLRSVALENARTILEKRQRAERQLIAIKDALEQRTQQLARSVAMMQATLESTFDGIIVTDGSRRVTGFNEKYTKMWRIPRQIMDTAEHPAVLAICAQQFADPPRFLARVEEIYATSPPESLDLLSLADGRVYERFSKIQYVEGSNAGRVWSFRDITAHQRSKAELREQRTWFEVTLSSIGDAVITTDVRGHVTFLNPIGEAMTGWTLQDARGVLLERIFNIVNEDTRAAGRQSCRQGAAGRHHRGARQPHGADRQRRQRSLHRGQRRPDSRCPRRGFRGGHGVSRCERPAARGSRAARC